MKNATAIAVAFSFVGSLYRPLRGHANALTSGQHYSCGSGHAREEAGAGNQDQKR
jgi:hypothetical protein